MTCTECHNAKVKCVYEESDTQRCLRCKRRGKTCVRHNSKQGQGRKRRRRNVNPSTEDTSISTEVMICPLLRQQRSQHFGLKYLIRSWISFAVRRRSFALLTKAADMAEKCGLTMDQVVLSSAPNQPPMEFLLATLLLPAAQQQVTGDRLRYHELRPCLLAATDCPLLNANEKQQEPDLGNRWIWVREMKEGISRYFLSSAFERDVASWTQIQEIYQNNDQSVVDLFLSPSERPKHTRGFAHQISLHATPDVPPRSNKTSNMQLQTNLASSSTRVVQVDQVACLDIVSLDHAFYLMEYIRSDTNTQERRPSSDVADMSFAFVDLDDSDEDKDLDFLLDLLL